MQWLLFGDLTGPPLRSDPKVRLYDVHDALWGSFTTNAQPALQYICAHRNHAAHRLRRCR